VKSRGVWSVWTYVGLVGMCGYTVVPEDGLLVLVCARGGSRNFHMGRPVKGPWGRISFG